MSKKLQVEEPTLNLFVDGDTFLPRPVPPPEGDASKHLQQAVLLAAALSGYSPACAGAGQVACNFERCPLWLDPCF